jgi:phosphoglycolate phosphatase
MSPPGRSQGEYRSAKHEGCQMSAATQLVLFDLDGTLIDSAPDLAAAANAMRTARGLVPLPLSDLRPMVGSGARGMVGIALGVAPGDDGFDALRHEFLERYQHGLLAQTAVFADMAPVLDRLDAEGRRWGIVTNKAARFTQPVVKGLCLHTRAAVVISGDTTPHSKPHPAPLLEAARRVGVHASACAYIGDDLRDVQAGRAAGMATLAAAWGYLGKGESIDAWGAHAVLANPAALLQWLQMA